MWMLLRAPKMNGCHLGVPAVALVAEVDASFEKLTHIECGQCHAKVLPIFRLVLRAPEKAPPVVLDHE